MLQPEIDHYHLLNTVEFDKHNVTSLDSSASSVIEFHIDISHADIGLQSSFNISSTIGNLSMHAGALAEFDTNKLNSMKLSRLLKTTQCGLVPLSLLELYDVEGSLSLALLQIGMNASIQESSLQKMFEFEGIQFTQKLSTLISEVKSVFDEVFRKIVPTLLYQAPFICWGTNIPDHGNGEKKSVNDNSKWLVMLHIFGGFGVGLALTAMLYVRWNQNEDTSSADSTEQKVELRYVLWIKYRFS